MFRYFTQKQLKQKNNTLIIWVFSSIVILIVYFIGYSYFTNINQSKQGVFNKLSAIVNTTASVIDGNLHARLSDKYLSKDDISYNSQDSLYMDLQKLLESIRYKNNLSSPLYTMVYNQNRSTFEFIGSSSIHPYYRHTYMKFPKELLEKFDIGGTLDVYKSENGEWLSAYAPIKNNQGKTIALIQADESFERFIAQARAELFQNIILALVIILPFTFLLFTYVRTVLNKEEKNQLMLVEKNEQIATQNTFIKENNNKLKAAQLLIEQKNTELNTRVRERTRKLNKANKELSTFLYKSSHDIQGPLATLRGLCQLASKDIDDPKSSGYFYMINDTTNKLYDTVKSINNVYEIKNKRINAETLKLKPLIAQVTQAFENDMKDKGISMTIDIEEDLAVKADKDITLLVFTELIKNSIQFNSRLNGQPPYIKVVAQQLENNIQIEVEDNGIGISPDTHRLIFEMFKTGNENSKGAGLGLYAAKLGVKKLKGSIRLSTENSQFTSFRVTMPAA